MSDNTIPHPAETLARVALLAVLAGVVVVPTAADDGPGQIPAAQEQPAAQTGAAADVTINEAGLFDLHLRQVPLPDALRMLSQRARRNISVTAGVNAVVSSDLYQVSFEEALEALLTPAGYTWFAQGKFIYVCLPEERESVQAANRSTELRVFELDFVSAADALPVVSPLLSPAGMIVSTTESPVAGIALTTDDYDEALNSGLGGKSRAIGEFLIVRDYAEVLDDMAAVLARLDARPRQVLIEAVILRARLDESNALGVDFNALGGIDFRTIGGTSVGATNLIPGAVPPDSLTRELQGYRTDVSAAIDPGGLSIGIMGKSTGVFIRALEEIVDLTIVANPKILAVNEQPGRVIVGREDGYLTATVTETATVQNVEFLETGTQILFRPFITKDGYVRMDIHPEDSSGGLSPENLPFKDTTEVTTNVLVKDGHTLVLGGLFREVVTSNVSQVPWFGNIPLVGNLFRGKIDSAVREEVIVLITPHIIQGGEDYEAAERLLGEVERWRTLAHRGLLPWGRERLAQAHYRWALEHSRAKQSDKALWDLELALSLNPRFVEASRLHERMTDEAATEPDNSVIRDLLHELAKRETEGATRAAGRRTTMGD